MVPLCPACCDYFDRDNDGACTNCGAHFRITLKIARDVPADLPGTQGDDLLGRRAPGAVAVMEPAPLEDPQPECPRGCGPVDPAAYWCPTCGWMGFEKYPAA